MKTNYTIMKKKNMKTYCLTMLVSALLIVGGPLQAQQKTWGVVLDENINGISKADDFGFYGAFGFAYTPDSRIWKTSDGGQNWTQETISGFSPAYPTVLELIKQVHYFDSSTGIHRFNRGSYYKTTDGGANFTLLSDSVFSNYTFTTLNNTHFANQNVMYKWNRAQRLSDSKLIDVILLSTDGGVTWNDISENLYNQYPIGENWIAEYVQFVSATTGFVFGQEGFYKTTDGGATWTLANALAGHGPIDFIDANTGYVAKHIGGLFDEVYKTTDGGANFTVTTLTDQVEFNTINLSEIFSIDFYDANNGVAGCSANGTLFLSRTTDGGQTWIQDTLADSISSISSFQSGFKPIQMVSPDAAFTQIISNTTSRYIIGFGVATNDTSGGNPSTSINEKWERDISIYPNPNTDHVLNINVEGSYSVMIYNANGQMVTSATNLTNLSTIELGNLTTGLYSVHIIGEEYNTTRKLLVK